MAPDALFEVVKLLQEHPEADLVYTDEDEIDEEGRRSEPCFKPAWSPELLLPHNYLIHLSVYRRSLLEEIGGFRRGFEGSRDYDLALRFTEKTARIFHVPKVLFHWKAVTGSTATGVESKPHTHERTRRALAKALTRRGIRASAEDEFYHSVLRARFEIEGEPRVSIVIPTRDNAAFLKRCVGSIEERTTYRNYEVLVVDNASEEPETVRYLSSLSHRIVRVEEEFNYARINNLAARAGGEYVLFLNDDTEVISEEWTEAMLEHARRPGVGAVGAKMLYPNGRIQHAGVVLGAGSAWEPGIAAHAHQHYPGSYAGYIGAVRLPRNFSAVTAACMMAPRSSFEEVGGFDEALKVSYNDVNLCLRMRERGYRIVYTPYAELYHHENASRGSNVAAAEFRYMRERWGNVLDDDPYFSLAEGSYNLRANALRPQILREDSEMDAAEHARVLLPANREEHRTYAEVQRARARSLRRSVLLPGREG